jgi:hypothetical protein
MCTASELPCPLPNILDLFANSLQVGLSSVKIRSRQIFLMPDDP